MRFSIITVCRNSEKVLAKARDSLAAQRYKDYEWVVIDSASTDGTLGIVRSFSSAPLHLVSEPDGGIYEAMNKGVSKARGDYVFFLNSDDALYDENVLNDINIWIEQNPDVDFIYGSVVNLKSNGCWLREFRHVTKQNIIEEGICHQAIFAKRELFDVIGHFDLRFRLSADYDWIIRVFRYDSRCIYIDRRIAFFSDGGAHTLDRSYLTREREKIRLQYIGRYKLAVRLFLARVVNRLYRIMLGHPRGVLRIIENDSR